MYFCRVIKTDTAMKKSIEIQGQTFTAAELKSQIESQYNALNGGRFGWTTLTNVNDAIKQAEEELLAINGRCPESATKKRAYEIITTNKLICY
jgi:hypothetical protein